MFEEEPLRECVVDSGKQEDEMDSFWVLSEELMLPGCRIHCDLC